VSLRDFLNFSVISFLPFRMTFSQWGSSTQILCLFFIFPSLPALHLHYPKRRGEIGPEGLYLLYVIAKITNMATLHFLWIIEDGPTT